MRVRAVPAVRTVEILPVLAVPALQTLDIFGSTDSTRSISTPRECKFGSIRNTEPRNTVIDSTRGVRSA